MLSLWPMFDVITVLLVIQVGFIIPSTAVVPEYEFDLHLYQKNISWLQCPEGWINFGITCITVITEEASFEESEINCQSYGGHLVQIDRLNKNRVIGQRSQDAKVDDGVWIGFWRDVSGAYQWTDGSQGNWSLGFWLPGQPEITHNDLKLCTYMVISSEADQYRWVLDRCDVKKSFICETDVCAIGDYRCDNGQCISAQWRCDGSRDCTDGSDELRCGTDQCGGFIEEPEFHYPDNRLSTYPAWVNCQWKIRAKIGYKVKLHFSMLDTEPIYDELRVYDGLSTAERLIGRFSGSNIQPDVTSTTNFLLVTFTTDHSVQRTGFTAQWTSVLSPCDSSLETLEADNNIRWVTSPGYPENYSNNLQCSWIIRAAIGEHVTLQIVSIDLLQSDWLEIRDGASRESTLIERYTGHIANEVLVSSGRHFYLHLHTDLQNSGTGFNMSYQSGCDITLNNGYGRISSPGFHAGKQYPNNLQCTWTLQDITSRKSTLLFKYFHTEPSYDTLQIYDSNIISAQTLLLNLSGRHDIIEPLRSDTGHFVVKFEADNLVTKPGWSASFSFDCFDNSPLPDHLSSTSFSAEYKSFISYSCDKGHRLEGTSKRYCDMNGAWNSTIPVCKLINCGAPKTLENGIFLNLTSRNYDGLAYYRCKPGHGIADIDHKVTCLENGWEGMPVCYPILCPKLKSVPNGIIYSPYLYHINTRADFKCGPGYRINGHMTTECKHGGKWSHPEPTCVLINYPQCAEVKVIHGSVNITGPVSVGEIIQVTCNHGYHLVSETSQFVLCNESGQFDKDLPLCEDINECEDNNPCGPQHMCHNILGSFWCECGQGYQHNSSDNQNCNDMNECLTNNGSCDHGCVNTEGGFICKCDQNYRLYTGNQTITVNRRVLVPNLSCYVTCENKLVENSTDLIYTTTALLDGSFLYPTSLHVMCPYGSQPDGPQVIHCQEDGSWSHNVTKCLVGLCEDLGDIDNGEIILTSDRQAGSLANYTCNLGYRLNGTRTRFCKMEVNSEGHVVYNWTGGQPKCEAVDCQTPPPIKNGNVTYVSTKFNNIAIYGCDYGYRLHGQSHRTCLFSGLWSAEVILCVVQTCQPLQTPMSGTLSTNDSVYGLGAIVSFTCQPGYQITDIYPMVCDIPEPYKSDIVTTSLAQLEFLVSVTVNSPETLDKLEDKCAKYYSQWLDSRLQVTIKRLQLGYAGCQWPADAEQVVIHKNRTINAVNTTTSEVIIVKNVHVYPAHTVLPGPIGIEEDGCLNVIDTRNKPYNMLIKSNDDCVKTYTSKLEIFEANLVCSEGTPTVHDGVTYCVTVKKVHTGLLEDMDTDSSHEQEANIDNIISANFGDKSHIIKPTHTVDLIDVSSEVKRNNKKTLDAEIKADNVEGISSSLYVPNNLIQEQDITELKHNRRQLPDIDFYDRNVGRQDTLTHSLSGVFDDVSPAQRVAPNSSFISIESPESSMIGIENVTLTPEDKSIYPGSPTKKPDFLFENQRVSIVMPEPMHGTNEKSKVSDSTSFETISGNWLPSELSASDSSMKNITPSSALSVTWNGSITSQRIHVGTKGSLSSVEATEFGTIFGNNSVLISPFQTVDTGGNFNSQNITHLITGELSSANREYHNTDIKPSIVEVEALQNNYISSLEFQMNLSHETSSVPSTSPFTVSKYIDPSSPAEIVTDIQTETLVSIFDTTQNGIDESMIHSQLEHSFDLINPSSSSPFTEDEYSDFSEKDNTTRYKPNDNRSITEPKIQRSIMVNTLEPNTSFLFDNFTPGQTETEILDISKDVSGDSMFSEAPVISSINEMFNSVDSAISTYLSKSVGVLTPYKSEYLLSSFYTILKDEHSLQSQFVHLEMLHLNTTNATEIERTIYVNETKRNIDRDATDAVMVDSITNTSTDYTINDHTMSTTSDNSATKTDAFNDDTTPDRSMEGSGSISPSETKSVSLYNFQSLSSNNKTDITSELVINNLKSSMPLVEDVVVLSIHTDLNTSRVNENLETLGYVPETLESLTSSLYNDQSSAEELVSVQEVNDSGINNLVVNQDATVEVLQILSSLPESGQQTSSFNYCNKTDTLPTGFRINQPGPVYMILTKILFKQSAANSIAGCAATLRELLRVNVQEFVNGLKLDLLCPDAPNIVLTNTSGSMNIKTNPVSVQVPFILYDNLAPFTSVQKCAQAVMTVLNSTFKASIENITEKFNNVCAETPLSLSDEYFNMPVASELCQDNYWFDTISNTCVYCWSCATTTTTPKLTTTEQFTTTPSLLTSTMSSETVSSTILTIPTTSSAITDISSTSSIISTTLSETTTTEGSPTTSTISTTLSETTTTEGSPTTSTISSTLSETTTTEDSTKTSTISATSSETTTTKGSQSTSTISTTLLETTTIEGSQSKSTISTTLLETTTIKGSPTTSTSITTKPQTTIPPVTLPSLDTCTSRSGTSADSPVPDLDLAVPQIMYWKSSEILLENLDIDCLDHYNNQIEQLLDLQELEINNISSVKQKCMDTGVYVRLTNLQLTAEKSKLKIELAFSYTKMTSRLGDFNVGSVSSCIARLVALPEYLHLKCLLYVGIVQPTDHTCQMLVLTGVIMSDNRRTTECSPGWTNNAGVCVKDAVATTSTSTTLPTLQTVSSTSVQTTSTTGGVTTSVSSTDMLTKPTPIQPLTDKTSVQTTSSTINDKTSTEIKTETSVITTTQETVVEETTRPGMHECYVCDTEKGNSNEDCINSFESCTIENPVCKTQVWYTGKTGQHTLSKGCESQDQCDIIRNAAAALCDRTSSNAYCVYCCNTSKCNYEVELLTFKGRRKRSVDEINVTRTANWNTTTPFCKDVEPPVFTDCPENVIKVINKRLPVSIHIPVPTAIDNSGITPSISVTPTDFTVPYWIHKDTTVTFTATDREGQKSTCVIHIILQDVIPPVLDCPTEVLKVYTNTTQNTTLIDYIEISENLLTMIDKDDVNRTDLIPTRGQSVRVLEEIKVTLTVWDHGDNSGSCSFIIIYIPRGCPLWTLGSPHNVNIRQLSSSSVSVECSKNSTMVHTMEGIHPTVTEYTCEQHAEWTPLKYIPDCIHTDLSVCPDWSFNISWIWRPTSFKSLDLECNITDILSNQIQLALQQFNIHVYVLNVWNITENGTINLYASLNMTTSSSSSPVNCPTLTNIQTNLDELSIPSQCEGSAILTSANITSPTMDCPIGLALVKNNQQDGRCWPCPRGMSAKTAVCELCPLGTYRDDLNTTECTPCPTNTTTIRNGSVLFSDCKALCSPGTFSSTGVVPCIECPNGMYQSESGSKVCLSCQDGFGTEDTGAATQAHCIEECKANEYSVTGFQPCLPCPHGFYNNQSQARRCQKCTDKSMAFDTCSDDCGGLKCSFGHCVTLDTGHICYCLPGFTGEACDIPISHCDDVVCQNGGICVVTDSGFSCNCNNDYTGNLCETKIDPCLSYPCVYGHCMSHHDNSSFSCLCFDGFEGKICDIQVDQCVDHQCQHGECINLVEDYECDCNSTGYYGDFCEIQEDHCQDNLCMNNGTCIDSVNGFTCKCSDGFEGPVCDQWIGACELISCQNGGQCVRNMTGESYCVCMSGYSGDTCQIDEQICVENLCQNGATCVQYPDRAVCQCAQGFTGDLCETVLELRCDDDPCNHDNSVECVDTETGYQCYCRPGWTGKECEEQEDHCVSDPCLNGGQCENYGTHFICNCLLGHAGQQCEHDVDECHSNPCMNGGVCIDLPSKYRCECTPHFSGVTCEQEIDGCQSDPCIHGTCLDSIDGYICSCDSDWTGTDCDEAINKCISLPCHNGGNCTKNETEFVCTCEQEYTGEFCETEIKPCDPNPCENAGECISENLTFTCQCPPGYYGNKCELVVNACDSLVCQHGGTCVEDGVIGRCECTSLYTGVECEKEKSDDFDITVVGDVLMMCETELVPVEDIDTVTMCLSYRYAPSYTSGLLLKLVDGRNETLVAVHVDRLELFLTNDSSAVVVEFGQVDPFWHQICFMWSATDGLWSVYFDQLLSGQGENPELNTLFSKFKISILGDSTPLFQGQITQVHVYSKMITLDDLHPCNHGNPGEIINWVMFDKCRSEDDGFNVTYPSVCSEDLCLPGYKGRNCDQIIDKEPPVVQFCPADVVSIISIDELRTVVSWSEPVFVDNVDIVRKNQTYFSGDLFTYGEYQVIYMAFDAEDNHAICNFHIIVTVRHCRLPSSPINGQRSCDSQSSSLSQCSISCQDPTQYQFTEEPAHLYICREGGVWDPPRGKQFTFPPCAGFSLPYQYYQGEILFNSQTCTEPAKIDLTSKVQQQFYQTGLCQNSDCPTSYITVDCVMMNTVKRSTQPVQYKVDFSIPSPSNPTMNSSSIFQSFESFVKGNLTGYTVADFTMDIYPQCDLGQVLSMDKQTCVNCGRGYYYSSDTRKCELCPLGSYTDKERQLLCTSCGDRQTTLSTGSTNKNKCFSICDLGYYLLDGDCEPCEIGYYQDTMGSTQCKPCLLGYTTQSNGSTDISDCYFPCAILGYIMSEDGSCIPCPRGSYKSDTMALTCSLCPSSFTTLTEGAGSVNLCVIVICNPGYQRNNDNECEPCFIGTYQNESGKDFCHRCRAGHTTLEAGSVLPESCILGEIDECTLQTDNCPLNSVCVDTTDSFLCECILGYTKTDGGTCKDNCLDVCIHGDCNYDTLGNPVCKCHDNYEGLKCDTEQGGLSAGSIIGISVAVVISVVLLALFVFICLRYASHHKGADRQLLRFPIHRTDLRSSFRAIALAMNPFESSTERTMSSVLRGNTRKSKASNNAVSDTNSNISSPSKTSYF